MKNRSKRIMGIVMSMYVGEIIASFLNKEDLLIL